MNTHLRRLTILVALFMLALAIFASGGGQAEAATCTTTLTSGGDIQAAINAATSGDVICLGPGTYSPTVKIYINKSITLQGPQAGIDPRPSAGSSRILGDASTEAVIDGTSGNLSGIIVITTDSVILDGLDIRSGSGDLIDSEESIPTSGTVLQYNIIHKATGDEGIQIRACTDCTIAFNYLTDIAQDGINMCCGSSGGTIQFNEVNDNSSENAAIYIYDASNTTIECNVVYDVYHNEGIKLGNKEGDDASLSGGSILYNNVFNTAQDGIAVYTSDTIVEGNEVSYSSSENGAIYVAYAVSNVSIAKNNVHDNTLDFTKWGDPGAIMIGTAVDAATVHVNNNNITGNSVNSVTNKAFAVLDVTDNWWGDASGPSGAGSGSGDAVSTNVAFNPWLSAPVAISNPCISDDEGPVTKDVVADPNPVAVNSSVSLSATVDDTDTGGSNIASAEYSLNGGDWEALDTQDGNFDAVIEDVSGTIFAPTSAGIYELCVRGTDSAGNLGDPECIMLVVYDPDGGFVTGGGWIDSPTGASSPIPTLVWDQGFEVDAAGWSDSDDAWYGMVTRVASGTNGVASSTGAYHALFEGDVDSGPFSRFDSYRDTWSGTWTAEIDVYLDPAWNAGTGFDYTVAASGSDGLHQRDYIFHVTKDSSTGRLLVAGSNNTNFAPREDLESINHYEVSTAGWYTLQHVFHEDAGALAVDLNLLDASGNALFTETRYNAADVIPAEVGGNRYAWFTFINVPGGVAVDEHQLVMPIGPAGKANFGFVAKYNKKSNLPQGNTEFNFKAADINFHSASYDWLIVNKNDSRAQFKGTGTINNTPSPTGDPYKFMLWAVDGDPDADDTFRIKIWYDDGGDVVVYDNNGDGEFGQVIGGGNIVVHSSKK